LRCKVLILISMGLALAVIEPSWATGLGMVGPGHASSPEEAYCLNHGGSPLSGKCYFPDGGYCNLGAFYNGTCPSQVSIEQAMWEAEAYAWLHSDNTYSSPVSPYNYGTPASYVVVGIYGTAAYWLNQANKLYLAGSYEQAATMYGRALNLSPSLYGAWLNLGNALYFLGRYNESLNAYDSVIRLNSQNALAWQGKGLDLLALNRTNEANDALAKARTLRG
jgi:tetratricopeptide (TPR) repeat protein